VKVTVSEDLAVGRYTIPAAELEWSFTATGGPGGQHANRSNTKVELRYDLTSSAAFPEEVRERLVAKLGEAELMVVVDETRSQWRNRVIARRRLAHQLMESMKVERPRRPTKPTNASKKRRSDAKRRRSETKRLRRRPEVE
jgi:ribosome-associated protein